MIYVPVVTCAKGTTVLFTTYTTSIQLLKRHCPNSGDALSSSLIQSGGDFRYYCDKGRDLKIKNYSPKPPYTFISSIQKASFILALQSLSLVCFKDPKNLSPLLY